MSDISDKVRNIVAEQLGVEIRSIKDDSNFFDDLGADSLDAVELVMAFEEEFDIEISEENAESINTIKSAIEYIENNRKG